MTKAIVVGSGLAGLTCGAYLAREGCVVEVYEQSDVVGGVTRTISREGFSWDIGPLVVEAFAPHEAGRTVLEELGCSDRVTVVPGDRSASFPDYRVFRPPIYSGPYWRRERLIEIFPDQAEGINRFYRLLDTITDLVALDRKSAVTDGPMSLVLKLGMLAKFLPIKKYETWAADRLMSSYFTDPKLIAFFTGILADMVVKPSEFIGLGIPYFNMECFGDSRMPGGRVLGLAPRISSSFVEGGIGNLSGPIAARIGEMGGAIFTKSPVKKIIIEDDRVRGVKLSDKRTVQADLVLVSGDARGCFFSMIGRDRLPAEFAARIDDIPLMESVFMVQLGLTSDPSRHQDRPLVYYYGTYDIEGAVQELRGGHYHEGRDGFLVFINSMHSGSMAPKGMHSVTIYTVAPNKLAGGWEARRAEMAEKLLLEAERVIPGLRRNVKVMLTFTPDDFKRIAYMPDHHSFAGLCPVMGKAGAPHKTPFRGLWFIGSQSESGGGVTTQVLAARKVVKMIGKDR
jgi:phytoene dehydrogenase-like protein